MDAVLLKETFDLVVPQKEAFAQAFYDRLFKLYPQTMSLFATTNMQEQQRSLISTLSVVVSGIARGENLVPAIQKLGQRHGQYGVMSEHYPMVGQAILETFAEFLGDRWTPAALETWITAFGVIVANMQQGALVTE